ncbi:MAG: permease, partial [Sulfurimonas sp.]
MLSLASFLKLLRESFRDLLPIVLVIMFFQLAIIQTIPDNWLSTTIGLAIVGVGLAIFLLGLEVGIFPVGEGLASDFAHKGSTAWIIIFAFMIGFGTTVAEPALLVIADKAAGISAGRIDAFTLRMVVAFSVGFAIVVGVWRIIKGTPIHYYIISGYILVVAATFFSPKEIVGLAFDLGGVTTSTVTVPLVAALGIGLASTIKGRNPVLDGFGLIAFASLTPMIFVQFYGIYVYQFVEASEIVVPLVVNATEATSAFDFSLISIIKGLFGVMTDVLPILGVILFFQYIILKKPIENIKEVLIGFGLVMLGLDAFIIGLEMGLFSLGETMAYQLTQNDNNFIIYSFAAAIGFSTTMAEPSLTAIARKAKEISDGKINDFVLRLAVAVGVALGIALGAFRIVNGGDIVYYIIVGYMFVIALTFIAPKYIVPIAYDSGGVTTSTITVPLVAALGLGLATNIPGRDPLIDGFGLIAFASLFPMITVMTYGVITQKMGLSTVNVHETGKRHSYEMLFSAVHVIVPHDMEEQAILIARDEGARGVTIMEAHGMGLEEMDNFYNRLHYDSTDSNLMFIVPTKKV